MKIIKILLTCLTLVLAVTFLFFQKDDPLSDVAAQMLNSHRWHTSSDAYLYLLGIGAELDEDPLEAGKEILNKIRESEKTYKTAKTIEDIAGFDYQTVLSVDEYDVFCSLRETACFDDVVSNYVVDFNNLELAVLKKRYLRFLGMSDLHSMVEPHTLQPFPSYSYLIKGNRLVILAALENASLCCPEQAAEELYVLIDLLKQYSLSTDYLVDKVVSYALIDEAIEVLSYIAREYTLTVRALEPLNKNELSFSRVMNGEFAIAHNISSILFLGDFSRLVPKWLRRVALKPNRTSNLVVARYQYAIDASELDQSGFEQFLNGRKPVIKEPNYLRNVMGSWLIEQSKEESYEDYFKRGFDLNAKIALFNGTLGKRITPTALATIENPYYADGHYASIDLENKRACFDGPLDDERHTRCLYMINE